MTALFQRLLLASSILCAVSCAQENPTLYDTNRTGAYFDPSSTHTFTHQLNFAQYLLTATDHIVDSLSVKWLGSAPTQSQPIYFRIDSIAGAPLAQIEVPPTAFAKGQYSLKVPIRVMRPAALDSVYAASIHLVTAPNSPQSAGVTEQSRFTIRVFESYQKPKTWEWESKLYFGDWTVEKHVFLVRATRNLDYATAGWDKYPSYNALAVDSLRRFYQQHPDSVLSFALTFNSEANYPKPYYWTTLHDHYLGAYSSATFSTLTNGLRLNTSNEHKALAGDEARLQQLNQQAVSAMSARYNQIFNWAFPGADFRKTMWVPILPNINYVFQTPTFWTGTTKPLIEQYYGEYSEEKYRFLVNAVLSAKGSQDFVLSELFPVMIRWDETGQQIGVWDNSIGGEAQIKACYQILRTAYNQASPRPNFDLPQLSF